MIFLWILLGIIFIILNFIIIGECVYQLSMKRKPRPAKIVDKKLYDENADYKIDMKWFKEQNFELISISSFDNLKLVAYNKNYNQSKKVAILIHGYTSKPESMIPYAKMFQSFGYNLLMPTLRAHDKSQGKFSSMGWLDRLDMLKWIEKAIEIYGKDCQIDVLGVSMGATTVAMMSGEKLPQNVKHLICDSAYSSILDQFKYFVGKNPFHNFGLWVYNFYAKIRCGFFLKQADATKQVEKTKTPILFIHGTADKVVPIEMMQKIYQKTPQNLRQKIVFEDTGHVLSLPMHAKKYTEAVKEFISSASLPKK